MLKWIFSVGVACLLMWACSNTPVSPDPPISTFKIPDNLPNHLPINVVHESDSLTAFEMGPQLVRGGSEDFVLRGRLTYNKIGFIRTISVFHGLDRGDIVEMDTEVRFNSDPLVLRSDHKEILASFDAWEDSPYVVNRAVRNITITLVCRVTGLQADVEHERYGSLTARPHWGILVDWKTEDENETSISSTHPAFAWWDTYFRTR